MRSKRKNERTWEEWKALPWYVKDWLQFWGWLKRRVTSPFSYTPKQCFIADHYWWFGAGLRKTGGVYLIVCGCGIDLKLWKRNAPTSDTI